MGHCDITMEWQSRGCRGRPGGMWGAELHLVSPGMGYRAVLFLLGGLFLGEGMEAKPLPPVGNIADPGTCPIIHRFVAPGVQATIPLHLPWASTALCKLDPRHVQCAWVLVLALGQAYYLDSAFQGHIVLHPLGLVIQDMTAEMEGEYQVLLGHNKTCLARVILTPVGHFFHYRFLLLLPGLLVMSVILLLWDWLIKVRSSTETHEGLTHMRRVPEL